MRGRYEHLAVVIVSMVASQRADFQSPRPQAYCHIIVGEKLICSIIWPSHQIQHLLADVSSSPISFLPAENTNLYLKKYKLNTQMWANQQDVLCYLRSRQVVGKVGPHLSGLAFAANSADGDARDILHHRSGVGLAWKVMHFTRAVEGDCRVQSEHWAVVAGRRYKLKTAKQPSSAWIFPPCASNVQVGGKECRQLLTASWIFTVFCGRPRHGLISPILPLPISFPLPLNVPVALLKVPVMPEATKQLGWTWAQFDPSPLCMFMMRWAWRTFISFAAEVLIWFAVVLSISECLKGFGKVMWITSPAC